MRHAICLAVFFMSSNIQAADVKLGESLPTGARVSVEINVQISGDMMLPGKSERLAVSGKSFLLYDERLLPSEDADAVKLLRIYRTLDIHRTVGGRSQAADIRKDVRRMVVMRTEKAKSPFSPDGPLTWGEIDVVKNDLFSPVLAAGLLPNKSIRDGDTWTANAIAIRELTELEKVSEGTLAVKFIGIVNFEGRDRARLSVSGVLKGIDDNGPCKHTLDGTAYFDLETSLLSYLSMKGSHELLDGEGRVAGRIDGRFTLTRKLTDTATLSDAAMAKLVLKPNAENTRMLYDNADLGIRFVHPRRWHVGAVQGAQVTLNGPNGAGILITKESAKSLPTAEAFMKESLDFLAKEKATTANLSKPSRTRDDALKVDRFGFDADFAKDKVRLEYAVVTAANGGATFSARLPRADARELADDVAVVLKELAITK